MTYSGRRPEKVTNDKHKAHPDSRRLTAKMKGPDVEHGVSRIRVHVLGAASSVHCEALSPRLDQGFN